jgi:hypothetical protein
MDTITSMHGLAPVYPTQPLQSVDINKLSYELTLELERLRQLFTVDAQKLKEISRRFEEELQEGSVAICYTIWRREADAIRVGQIWFKHCR